MKPIQVWLKQSGQWRCVFDTDNPPAARDYAANRISYSGWNLERVEIRDHHGAEVLDTVFDKDWK